MLLIIFSTLFSMRIKFMSDNLQNGFCKNKNLVKTNFTKFFEMYVCSGSASGIQLRKVKYDKGNLTVAEPKQLVPDCHNFTFSPDYKYVCFYTKSGVHSKEFPDKFVQICRFDIGAGTIEPLKRVNVPNILSVKFSPKSTFICVMCRRNIHTDEGKIPLIQIFRTETGETVRAFNYNSQKVPEVFWSADEKVFCSSKTDGICFFETKPDGTEEQKTIELPKLLATSFTTTKSGKIRFAVVYDDSPRKLKIFEYPEFTKQVAYRPIMVGETFTVKISPNGASAVAIGTKNESDATFYGDSYGFYVNDQNKQDMTQKKAGPVHCVEYSPSGDKFVYISGHVPPCVQIFYEKIHTNADIGEFSLNSVRYSCNQNIAAIGGFGSFTGTIMVYDLASREKISEGEAPYTSEWSWSPCGRLLISAVLYPKMMVGNEFRIINHMSQILFTAKETELTQADWVGIQRPQPLPPIKAPIIAKPQAAAYVPPHLRNKQGGTVAGVPRYPPGYAPPSGNIKKSKR